MKKKYYPKILFPSLKLAFILWVFLFFMFIIFKLFENTTSKPQVEIILSGSFIVFLFGYLTFHLTFFFCFYFKYIITENNTISIFELKKLKSKKTSFDEILGFSISEAYFGKFTWKTKSIVIYYKSGEISEILNNFVMNLDEFEKELKSRKIKYLGFEHYNTGWFYRKYKYNK
jgi:hypothetical protein